MDNCSCCMAEWQYESRREKREDQEHQYAFVYARALSAEIMDNHRMHRSYLGSVQTLVVIINSNSNFEFTNGQFRSMNCPLAVHFEHQAFMSLLNPFDAAENRYNSLCCQVSVVLVLISRTFRSCSCCYQRDHFCLKSWFDIISLGSSRNFFTMLIYKLIVEKLMMYSLGLLENFENLFLNAARTASYLQRAWFAYSNEVVSSVKPLEAFFLQLVALAENARSYVFTYVWRTSSYLRATQGSC